MAHFQIIQKDSVPEFAVLPYGDWEALEDYADELWARNAVKNFEAHEPEKTYTMAEAKALLT